MKNIFELESELLITCAPDIRSITEQEIQRLNIPIESSEPFGILVKGNVQTGMKLCCHLRTANKVLFKIDQNSGIKGPQELYQWINNIPWENFFTVKDKMSIEAFAQNDTINDTRFAGLKCKDAIVDRFNKLVGKRPDSGPERDGIVLYLHWRNHEASIYFDLSGEPIAKHGYRLHPWKAPLMENLAAAIILATKWNDNIPLINPMCGSGTLAIEAALIGLSKPPGFIRRRFSFMLYKGYNETMWQEIKAEATKYLSPRLNNKIIASDISEEAIELAKENAKKAGVEHLIEFQVCDFAATSFTQNKNGMIILNPEYGDRLGEEEQLKETYTRIGEFFKKKCSGMKGYIFTGNLELAKNVGLKTSQKIPFYNARIECRLMGYELYDGTKKVHKIKRAD
jgi:23S rRNA G2445 N2-methylase RlmL